MKTVLDYFLEYVQIDTQSDETQAGVICPTTDKQFNLARKLMTDLKSIGLTNEQLYFDEKNCYLYAKLPASKGLEDVPAIGFISHMDTSPEISDTNVKPRLVNNYDGSDIVLNKEQSIVLSPKDYPELSRYLGKTLVVTDGNTLLGADDKAGISEIIAMIEYFVSNPDVPHGRLSIAFTPDEEVGCGADFFDVKGFGADYAYTVDGGPLGELEYENFNAADAKLSIQGRSVHPGSAKNKMLNAILLGQEFHSLLPVEQNPMYTEGYEGFFHLESFEGSVDQAKLHYIIRDHDKVKFEQKKQLFHQNIAFLNQKYGQELFVVEMYDSYYNMLEQIRPHMHLIEHARKAMEMAGVLPKVVPIRGGTDGARLSFMGLPCPNLCTGGDNFHGRYEYACVEDMQMVVEILKNIVTLYTEK
ncbi:MAG: peptidase T [Lachnospiraceae bacterium]|nr:peptidase T [Lachnospiraceae bacterium]